MTNGIKDFPRIIDKVTNKKMLDILHGIFRFCYVSVLVPFSFRYRFKSTVTEYGPFLTFTDCYRYRYCCRYPPLPLVTVIAQFYIEMGNGKNNDNDKCQ